jgi:hypothetical protein
MALGKNYRFVVQNATGVTLPANRIGITGRRWFWNISGLQQWETAEATFVASGDGQNASAILTNNSYGTASGLENGGSAYLGGTFKFRTSWNAAGVTPNGIVTFFLQRSTDGGTTWPDNGMGDSVCVLACTAQSIYIDTREI